MSHVAHFPIGEVDGHVVVTIDDTLKLPELKLLESAWPEGVHISEHHGPYSLLVPTNIWTFLSVGFSITTTQTFELSMS